MSGTTWAVVATAYGGPEVLDVVEVEVPPPGPGRVAVDVRAAGVNPADAKAVAGAWGADPARLPLRVGFEAAGVVAAVGEGVDGVAVGDEVVVQPASGAWAGRFVVRADAVVPKPSGLTWERAGSLLVAATAAAHAVEATGVARGDRVVVLGAGGAVGTAVCELALDRGARVVGVARPEHHARLAALGVAVAEPVELRRGVGAPYDVVVDAAGDGDLLLAAAGHARDVARVASLAAFDAAGRIGALRLGSGGDPGTDLRRAARADLLARAADGRLSARVGGTFPLSEAAAALRAARTVDGKVVLVP